MSKRKTWSRKKLSELQKWADSHGAKRTDQNKALPGHLRERNQVAILKSSQESGMYGSRRKPKTITDLRERNDAIRKEYERYQRNRVPRAITLIARHFQLSTRQVGRILTRPK